MSQLPTNPPESFKRRNPHIYGDQTRQNASESPLAASGSDFQPKKAKRLRQSQKPLMNKLETRYRDYLASVVPYKILEQAITLALDPPFKSYRPDLAYCDTNGELRFFEVKGPHRFREKGIAKAALAAKTYPMFKFYLCEWKEKKWKETIL